MLGVGQVSIAQAIEGHGVRPVARADHAFNARLEEAGGPSDPALVAQIIGEVRRELERDAASSAAEGEAGR